MSRITPSSSSGRSGGSRLSPGGKKKQQGGGGLLHRVFDNPVTQVVENLANDVKDTVVGLPTGLVMAVRDPVAVGKAMANTTWATWSPLFKGDFDKFAKGVYDHPLAPILDVLSVATLGAGSGARVAGALGKAQPNLTRALRSGIPAKAGVVVEHTKAYNRNPFIRARQVTTEKAVNGLAGLVPSWFAADKLIPEEVLKGFNGKERADAWRWLRADKYDEASRRHATSAASSLAIAGIMSASKRLRENPAEAAQAFIPNIISNLKDHAHAIPEADLPEDVGKLESRYTFVDAKADVKAKDFLKKHPDITAPQLADFLASKGDFSEGRGMAGKLVTSDPKRAARDADGNLLVARNHGHYLEEAANSTHFLGQLTKSATTAWKWAILGLRPAYLVNNAVGNMFMYMVSTGPQGLRGLTDAMRQMYSPAELQKGMGRAEKKFYKTSIDWQDRYYLGLHRGFAKDASDMMAGETVRIPMKELGGKAAKLKRIAGTGLYDITHTVSDRVIRRMAINTILRAHPEVKALQKQGMHFDDAAAAVSQNRAVREAVQQRVNDILGQYHYLNPAERVIRAVVPFYTWDRAIVRHGAHLYLDRPTTAAAMTQLGAIGTETTEQMLGQIPDFLRGALPLSLIGLPESVDGRVPILGTSGINPYSSLDSVIKAGQALTTGNVPTGEVFAGQLNPFLTAAIEQTTGQSLLSGARLPESSTEGGLVPNILSKIIGGLPQSRIVDTAVTGPDGTEESLYPGDTMQFLYAYLGVPAKALNIDVAAEMASRRDGVPATGRRSRMGGG